MVLKWVIDKFIKATEDLCPSVPHQEETGAYRVSFIKQVLCVRICDYRPLSTVRVNTKRDQIEFVMRSEISIELLHFR